MCSRVGRDDPQLAVEQDHALVDRLHQQPIARLGLPPAAQVTGHRHDAVLALVLEAGRMHLHREAAAIAAHVGDFDDVGLAPMQGFPDRVQVVAGQVRVQQFDRLADDLLTGAAIGTHAGLVEVQHHAAFAEDADRVGDGIEQGGIAAQGQLSLVHRFLQGLLDFLQQAAQVARRVGQGAFQGSQRVDVGSEVITHRSVLARAAAFHVAARALPVLLPVSRPSRAASQRPVAASAGRSMPVRMPMPCSM